ncbi:MAG TPA: hypothetical protein VF773_21955 [Verrucomicrobiae bacterium]
MKPISLRSLLCLAGFLLLALLPRAIRSYLRQADSQPPPPTVPGRKLLEYHALTNHPAQPPVPNDKLRMDPQLTFIPSPHSTIRIAEGIEGEIILTGPTAMIQNLEIRQFTLSPASAGHFTYTFSKTPDGTWQQQRLRKQSALVEINSDQQKINLHFRWQPPSPEDQAIFHGALHGVDVTLTYTLDGKELRLAKRGVPVARTEKNNVLERYSIK